MFVKYSAENKKSKKCIEYSFVGYYTDSLIPDNYRERLSGISYDNNADPYGVYNHKMVLYPIIGWLVSLLKMSCQIFMGKSKSIQNFP